MYVVGTQMRWVRKSYLSDGYSPMEVWNASAPGYQDWPRIIPRWVVHSHWLWQVADEGREQLALSWALQHERAFVCLYLFIGVCLHLCLSIPVPYHLNSPASFGRVAECCKDPCSAASEGRQASAAATCPQLS